jgi:hypothetical protein
MKHFIPYLVLVFTMIPSAVIPSPMAHEGSDTEEPGTILVDSVVPDSPADAAGLQAGDYLVALDGRKLETQNDLHAVMEAHQPGDTVPLTVVRDGEAVDLKLTFGEREDGGVSIGVRLEITAAGSGEGTAECLTWIEETYRLESTIRDLDLELSADYEAMLECVARDTRRMATEDAIKYCDNVLKGHCSGLDLLAEIGEALVQQCGGQLHESLGLTLDQYKGWRTCAQHKVFDRYSRDGVASDEHACRAALLDECGTNIDAAITAGAGSPEQQGFAECCSADAFDAESRGDSGSCRMIDDGFERGPCHDRSVCVNRLTSEWIHCSVVE